MAWSSVYSLNSVSSSLTPNGADTPFGLIVTIAWGILEGFPKTFGVV